MLNRIIGLLWWRQKALFNFWLPNLFKFSNKRIRLGRRLRFSQHTILTGAGFIEIGDACSFGYKAGGFHRGGSIEIQARRADARITIGKRVSTNNNLFICSSGYIEVGDDTLIGQGVTIMDFEAHGIHPEQRRKASVIGSVVIESNVWIGNNVIVLKNSRIGAHSIIAAGAVVSGTFPPNVIIGGVPARILKTIE